jgi:hypothetical protein
MEIAIVATVTGILAHNMPGQQVIMRELYEPFDPVVPRASLGTQRGRG